MKRSGWRSSCCRWGLGQGSWSAPHTGAESRGAPEWKSRCRLCREEVIVTGYLWLENSNFIPNNIFQWSIKVKEKYVLTAWYTWWVRSSILFSTSLVTLLRLGDRSLENGEIKLVRYLKMAKSMINYLINNKRLRYNPSNLRRLSLFRNLQSDLLQKIYKNLKQDRLTFPARKRVR